MKSAGLAVAGIDDDDDPLSGLLHGTASAGGSFQIRLSHPYTSTIISVRFKIWKFLWRPPPLSCVSLNVFYGRPRARKGCYLGDSKNRESKTSHTIIGK